MTENRAVLPENGSELGSSRCQDCPLPHQRFTPNLSEADLRAVLDNLEPGECACQRLRYAEDWSPILGEMYSKTRLLRAKRAASDRGPKKA